MGYRFKEQDSHPRHKESRDVENVLVLQGGGSLGAFACGVFKALVKKNVRIDIVAGTSIGAVNAAIIVGSKSDHPEKELEDFWIEIAESSPNIIPDIFVLDYDNNARKYVSKKISAASANARDVWCSQNVYSYMVALVSLVALNYMRIIIIAMVFFIIAIKESNKNTTMTFLTQEIGLISMTIRHLQKHLINT